MSSSYYQCIEFSAVKLEIELTLFQATNLDSAKLKEFADDNFKFAENSKKFSKSAENTVEKRRNCSLRAISPFPTVFLKDFYCRHVKTTACLGKS